MKRKLLKEAFPNEKTISGLHKKFNHKALAMKKSILGKDFEKKIKDNTFQKDVLSFFRLDPVKSATKRAKFKKGGKDFEVNQLAPKILKTLFSTSVKSIKKDLRNILQKDIKNAKKLARTYIFWLYQRNQLGLILLRASDQYLESTPEENQRPPVRDKYGEAKDPMETLEKYNKSTKKLLQLLKELGKLSESKKTNEAKIILNLRKQYKKRLAEAVIKSALEEVDMYDSRGNMLLAKDLKVRHKASGYEYTVDHVEGEGDEAVVYLRHPEEPRVIPPDANLPLQEKTSVSLKGLNFDNIAGGQELDVEVPEKVDLDQQSLRAKEKASLLAVKRKEFEKEYEVD